MVLPVPEPGFRGRFLSWLGSSETWCQRGKHRSEIARAFGPYRSDPNQPKNRLRKPGQGTGNTFEQASVGITDQINRFVWGSQSDTQWKLFGRLVYKQLVGISPAVDVCWSSRGCQLSGVLFGVLFATAYEGCCVAGLGEPVSAPL